ncbi:MAG: hypothetical protein E7183_03510 [Erysipelotrichaceae bacterium]|nr:hypothetical protein [Erysipelotrichaceae bacterium]
MKLNNYLIKLKTIINTNKKIIYIISSILTLLFSIFNRILGIIKHSMWHETISIYYLLLVLIKGLLLIFIYKNHNNYLVKFKIIKVLLIILNIFLIFPIILLINDKRIIEMTLIPSICVALYVTIKSIIVIEQFIRRSETNILIKELRTINLMDVVISILTLTNTLIAVNSNEYNIKMHYLTVIVCIIGYIFNCGLLVRLKIN